MRMTLSPGPTLVAGFLAAAAIVLAFFAIGPALVTGAIAVFVLLLAIGTSGTRAPLATTPIEVPPEESEQKEGVVTCCLRCGSTDVGAGSVLQGQIPGAGDAFAYVCHRCGHRGAPLTFDDPTAYREFVKGLNEPR